MAVEPEVKSVVRLEADYFLQQRQAEYLAIIHLWRGSASRDDLAARNCDSGVSERVIDGGVQRDDKVFEFKCVCDIRHDGSPLENGFSKDLSTI